MWRERDNQQHPGALAMGALLLLALAAACVPDGPDDGLPTHPDDTYSVSLEWDAPTTDAMGRPLQDLAGYRLYYRQADSPEFGSPLDVDRGTLATVDGLAAGRYVFAVTALDTEGNESDLSDPLPLEVGP